MRELSQIGKILRKYRIEHNKRQCDVAKYLGVSTSFISAVETGKKRLPVDLLDSLSKLFNLTEQEKRNLYLLSNNNKYNGLYYLQESLQIIKKAQKCLLQYLLPDTLQSAENTVNQLLGIFDNEHIVNIMNESTELLEQNSARKGA